MLCRSGQLRSGSVITHFHFDNSAATNSAAGEYGTVPEPPSKTDEQSSINEKRTVNTPSSGPNIKTKSSKIT